MAHDDHVQHPLAYTPASEYHRSPGANEPEDMSPPDPDRDRERADDEASADPTGEWDGPSMRPGARPILPRPDDSESDTPESPEAWLARVDAAVAAMPPPETSFVPALPGVQPDAAARAGEDVSIRQAKELDDNHRKLLADALPLLLPLAMRLLKLHTSAGKRAHLDAALDALGFGPVRMEGESYAMTDADGNDREYTVRQGQVYVPEDRARVLAALAEAS